MAPSKDRPHILDVTFSEITVSAKLRQAADALALNVQVAKYDLLYLLSSS
jgi:hypothetical protein